MFDVFDAPSQTSAQLQDMHFNYVLIDGSKRAEAERWLYELVDTPDYRNLFDGTEWASIRDVAPLLVRTERGHPLLEQLSLEGKAQECGTPPLGLQRHVAVRRPHRRKGPAGFFR